MIKLRKYLRPFAIGLVIAIVLLFVQALCDLNLPNFMSDIVNVGIQQNGIESGAPEAITEPALNFMRTFMTDEEKTLIDENYVSKSASDTNEAGKTYESLYPDLGDKTVYIRNADLDKETLDKISAVFGGATWTMVYTLQDLSKQQGGNMPGVENQNSSGDESKMDISNVDITKLYAMQPMLSKLPPPVLDPIINSSRDRAHNIEEAMLSQSATVMTGAFYKELGLDVSKIQIRYIVLTGVYMLLIALLGGICVVFVSLISSRIAAGVARNLRNDIFEKVERFSNAEFDKFSTASLITRSTNDVTQIQMLLVMGIRMICYAPMMAIGGIIMALNKSVSMGWIIALACILLIGIILVIIPIVMPKFKSMQKLIDRLNLVARETLNGLMVIRAFGTRNFEEKRFDGANRDLAKVSLFANRTITFMFPVMMLIMNGVTMLIIWVGSHNVAEATMKVGDMMAFMQYSMMIIMSFLMISMMFIFIPRAAVSAARIAEVLETEPSIVDPKKPLHINQVQKGRIEFKNVSFRYHGAEEDALKDISFVAHPGETTAFIGATGSGKTTLINLIPRFYDATGGEVLVDGVNVKDVPQKELRSHIGYVPQKSVLMSGTIASNIKYGNENASDEILNSVASVAQAMEFISEKTEGFNSEISQGGSNVSGGQKQRLSIARALAINPDIYIFDDSFSALDFKTDGLLRQALSQYTDDATVLIVAQRVSTIMNADRIYVIDAGEIIGAGTHRELLKTCPEYYEIASSQLSKEELDNE